MDNRRSQSTRIVIADDHPIFRDGLRRLLETEPDLKVIGEACDGAEAVKMARQLKPDILLLDLAMPRHPGLEALREMSSASNQSAVRVILLTAAAEKNQIVEALQLGARGVVAKIPLRSFSSKPFTLSWRGNIGWDVKVFPTLCSTCEPWFNRRAKKLDRKNSVLRLVNWRLFRR